MADPTKKPQKSTAQRERVTKIIAAIMRKPATLKQLSLTCGISEANIGSWVNLWLDQGLVYIHSYEPVRVLNSTNQRVIYARKFGWSEGQPFSHVDAVKPVGTEVRAKIPRTAVLYRDINAWLGMHPLKTKKECAVHYGVSNATVSRACAAKRTALLDRVKAETQFDNRGTKGR